MFFKLLYYYQFYTCLSYINNSNIVIRGSRPCQNKTKQKKKKRKKENKQKNKTKENNKKKKKKKKKKAYIEVTPRSVCEVKRIGQVTVE